MKTAEEIKNAIIENQIDITGWCISPNSTMITMIKACMEEYAEQFKPKWIPVSERLPEPYCQILGIMEDSKNIYICYYNKSTFTIYGSVGIIEDMMISHWMNLPEGP